MPQRLDPLSMKMMKVGILNMMFHEAMCSSPGTVHLLIVSQTPYTRIKHVSRSILD